MNNYGTAITNDEVIVPQKKKKKKKYPKTLLLLVPIILLIICLFKSHKNNDVVVTKLLSNNSNTTMITINYDAARTGPICVSMDNNNNNNNNNNDSSSSRLQLVWKENHNLYQLPNEISFRNCDFSNATLLQKAGPNPTGYMVKMNNMTTTTMTTTSSIMTTTNQVYYFACSKLCASNGHKVQVCVGNNGQENNITAVATNTKNECSAARTYDLRRQQP